MKILLILPRSKLYQEKRGFKRNLRYSPLTLTTLAGLVPKDLNAEIRIIDEGVEFLDYSKINADLVGITCITGTSLRTYSIADSFRKRGITVVLGGVHPTLMPQEAKTHADAVVVGLAVKTWPQLLLDFKNKCMKEFYHDPNPCIDNMPFPRRDLLRRWKYITINTVQATYGCFNKCDFCVIHKTRPKFLKRPVQDVINEIKALKTKLVLFLDPSPTEDVEYIKELYRNMIPLKIKWMGLATTKICDDEELFDLMVKSGCAGLLIGFESISKKSLAGMRKGFNNVDKYEAFIRRLHMNNIAIMGCFVFGTDFDDKTVFKETVDFISRTGIDMPRFTVVTPFPGTDLHAKLKSEHRLLSEDWSLYNAQNVVFKPKKMTAQELQSGLEWAWKECYTWKNIWKRLWISKVRTLLMIITNIGYRRYAKEVPEYR